MKVTYISHSGFLAELPDCTWLFDYYEGEVPAVRPDKPLFVFVSHWHSDHFNPDIFSMFQAREIHYILSSDTKKHMKIFPAAQNLHFMKPKETMTFSLAENDRNFRVQTLPSTDCGVAFLIFYAGKYIYYAGDLNWWVWKGETTQYNNNMTAQFKKYTEPLKNLDIFAAFLPLDSRQEDWYDKGFLHVMETANVSHAFPMHFWKDFSVIPRFLASPKGRKYKKQIIEITAGGQSYEISNDS